MINLTKWTPIFINRILIITLFLRCDYSIAVKGNAYCWFTNAFEANFKSTLRAATVMIIKIGIITFFNRILGNETITTRINARRIFVSTYPSVHQLTKRCASIKVYQITIVTLLFRTNDNTIPTYRGTKAWRWDRPLWANKLRKNGETILGTSFSI